MILSTLIFNINSTDSTQEQIRDYLQRIVGHPIVLIFTSNTVTMISIRQNGKIIRVRLQQIFLTASIEILDEIAHFIINKKSPMPKTNSFIKENSSIIRDLRLNKISNPERKVTIRTLGNNYDLNEIFSSINNLYFSNSITSPITWGRKSGRRRVKVRRLGSYNRISKIITINQILDSKKIPLFYLEFIVYHEMLHAHLGIKDRYTKNGGQRYLSHTKEFREKEKCFKDYIKAVKFQI